MNGIITLETVLQMPGMQLPVRSTAVQLGALKVLISPGSKLTVEQLRSLGSITDLVANNNFHNAGMKRAREVFPEARAWGVPGSPQPLILSERDWPYRDELPMVLIEGMPKINEAVFFHPPSKTLIVADLIFNLLNAKGLGAWCVLHLFGTYRRFAVSRFFARFIDDKQAFEKSLMRVMDFDFDRILMGHGEPILANGRDLLRSALHERGFLT